jgi:hypothetical protein
VFLKKAKPITEGEAMIDQSYQSTAAKPGPASANHRGEAMISVLITEVTP